MKKKSFVWLPVICALFTACSSPLLEWIEAESGTTLYASGKGITAFSFSIPGETDTIGTTPSGGITPITVVLPIGTPVPTYSPTIEYIGKSVGLAPGELENFTGPVKYRVTAADNTWRDYEVNVIVKTNTSKEIIWFNLELPGGGSLMAEGLVTEVAPPGPSTIAINVPSGTDTTNLVAKIVHTGASLGGSNINVSSFLDSTGPTDTAIAVRGNFFSPSTYTVTPVNGPPKTYTVTVTVLKSANTGISDFKVRCYLTSDTSKSNPFYAQVVVGTEKRTSPVADGKIPIVIHVPYGTNETDMYAEITLPAGVNSAISPVTNTKVPFGNEGNNKEAVYTVTAENGDIQKYVALVSEGPQYYYVDGVYGKDDWPDIHNGGSESQPFKTLANAVKQAAIDGIPKVLIMGDLTAANGGSTTGGSAFDIDLSSVANNNKVTIASNVDGGTRTLRGTSPQRVLSITGGANLVFENIDITGGDTSGNGGGIYVAGNSKVNFSGNITGNTARSGGGVYLEAGTGPSDFSSFTLTSGSAIANNTAFGTGVPASAFNVSAMEGGGGVYIKGNATFTLASGTISGNTTKGSGGGVLVNGNVDGGTEYGLLMPTGGEITGNRSTGDDYPHGGGGVYVAQGGFTMAGGKITGNTATRQGGGVFVHWANSSTLTARFTASGDSVITGNKGVGSSKAICNRGITELKGNTEADFVYIWDYDTAALPQSFSLADHVQVTTGIAFARANTASPNKNFIQLMTGYDQTGIGENKQIVIDLESHLEGGNYAGTLVDWIGQTVITGAHNILEDMNNNNRFILGTFKGATTVSGLSNNYKIDVDDTKGKFVTK